MSTSRQTTMAKPELGKVDPNVFMPEGVRRASARATQIHNEAYSNPQQENPEVKPTADTGPVAAPVDQPPADTNTPPPAAPVAPAANPSTDIAAMEAKLRSMEGRFAHLNSQNQAYLSQINDLQDHIQILTNTLVEKSAEEPDTTDKDKEEYGPELVEMVNRQASKRVKELERTVAKLETQLGDVNNKTAKLDQAGFNAAMDARLPNWREINSNAEFMAWLQQEDGFSGETKHKLLTTAYQARNVDRVLKFFNGFISEVVAPARAEPTKPEQGLDLASLAAPGKARTAATNTGPSEKPSITRQQIKTFYDDSAAGKYRNRPEEYKKMEALIKQAMLERRVI